MQTLSGLPSTSARALASAERVREVLVAEPAVVDIDAPDAALPSPDSGELEFAAVELGVDGLTLTGRLVPGAMTGLVCGHALAAARVPLLIAREQDPVGGRIVLDGSPLGSLPLRTLRTRVLVALHDAALLPGSIAQNLSAVNADIAAVERAARTAGVDEIAGAVPHGLDASVGDRGETLSGGQRQRIALARALAADAGMLVLHDPTTAVDSATEDGIARRVHEARAGRTTLVVTTSPAWLNRCENVIFVDERGCRTAAHHELMDDPAYRATVTR